jgi:hypothetical protein
VTKPFATVQEVFRLKALGWNHSQISQAARVNRATVRAWLARPLEAHDLRRTHDAHTAATCSYRAQLPAADYAYLLGQYLGDGCLSAMGPRGVFRLRVATCDAYPEIRNRLVLAIEAVMPDRKVGIVQSVGCTEISGYSKHWPCLFPQHGPGRKHERSIVLEPWQQEIVNAHTKEFLAGLIHSDGCRCVNNIVTRGKPYSYPRYFFTNVSEDILMLCADAFDRLGVEWKRNRWNSLSVAKRDSVALLDTFIGPKT